MEMMSPACTPDKNTFTLKNVVHQTMGGIQLCWWNLSQLCPTLFFHTLKLAGCSQKENAVEEGPCHFFAEIALKSQKLTPAKTSLTHHSLQIELCF